ncbi:MAG: ABC transporter substrate-binding protein [Rhodospirillaceae bacterium]|nr:ABC transporter substrate-binding protein [Rhodospirillaceae bacterium]
MTMDKVRIGAGAGYAGDRWEPALELVERGDIDFLAFECLAERTIARETQAMLQNPERGYNPLLVDRIRGVLKASVERGVRIVSNMGAANPRAAAKQVLKVAEEEGVPGIGVAVLLGDDVREVLEAMPGLTLIETGEPLESILPRMASANAYLGADGIKQALDTGAEVVMTGRVADSSLFVGPLLHSFGWSYDDYGLLAQATLAGHLLECAGQVTGGYFADPGRKDVADLARLGFPFADITSDGQVTVSKAEGSGGRVDRMTCTEQLLYELHDPTAYITPDCVLDITDVDFDEVGPDRVRARGARANPRTPTYKVSVGYPDGFFGEGQISYGGPNAVARARLAGEVVRERLKLRGFLYDEMRIELIGMESLHGPADGRTEPYEVRLRIVGRTDNRRAAEAVGLETETLLTNGPAGGAGDFRQVKEIYAVQSVLLERRFVDMRVEMVEAA